jgi:hypothetical protein
MPAEQMELFYHAEPFDVACNLADNALDVKDHLDEYLEIRDGGTAATNSTAREKPGSKNTSSRPSATT